MERGQSPATFEIESRDWDDLVDLGGLGVYSDSPSYLFGIPVLVYAQGFPQGVIWIRDQNGDVGVELAHECVTGDNPMSRNPLVHEYDVHPHPQEFVEVARGHLTAGGFEVFTFTLAETVRMAKEKGYHDWLSLRGYDFRSCEPVWFKLSNRKTSVHLMLGALKLPAR